MSDLNPSFRCPIHGGPIKVNLVLDSLHGWTARCLSKDELCQDFWMCPLNEGSLLLERFLETNPND